MTANERVALIFTDPVYATMCRKLLPRHAQDLLNETTLVIMELPQEQVPEPSRLRFLFYRIAYQIASPTGQLGKYYHRKEKELIESRADEQSCEIKIRKLEEFMLSLNELENRIVHLYVELGDMKKVHRATGISYGTCRKVKDKILNLR